MILPSRHTARLTPGIFWAFAGLRQPNPLSRKPPRRPCFVLIPCYLLSPTPAARHRIGEFSKAGSSKASRGYYKPAHKSGLGIWFGRSTAAPQLGNRLRFLGLGVGFRTV